LKLGPGVHLIHTRVGQALLIEGPPLTLIDTGARGSYERIRRTLESLGHRVEDLDQILITHAHSDHLAEAARLKEVSGAKILMHPDDRNVAEGTAPQYPLNSSGLMGKVASRFSDRLEKMNAFSHFEVDGELEAGQVIDPGIEVIFTPGHTPGHCSVYLPEAKVLHAGDAIFNIAGTRPPWRLSTQNELLALDSLSRLPDYDFTRASFGHGPPIFRRARERLSRLAKHHRIGGP
jgi:glyoxylase-like metal-dependent hydrolase (beta-lactamase superfamily II)